jgi:type IV secretory pathway TrbL component
VMVMGKTITHAPTDPSSIVSNGIALANSIMEPVKSFDIFHITFGAIIILIVYVVIVFAFISIALELAKTLIITTALISVSSFFLSFAALEQTSKIAHHLLEAVLGNCMKLLGIYLIVGTGTQIIINLSHLIPASETSFDDYWWLLSVVILFWMLAKQLPEQLARLVSFHLTTESHANVSTMSMAVLQYAKSGGRAVKSLMKPGR